MVAAHLGFWLGFWGPFWESRVNTVDESQLLPPFADSDKTIIVCMETQKSGGALTVVETRTPGECKKIGTFANPVVVGRIGCNQCFLLLRESLFLCVCCERLEMGKIASTS